MSEPIIALGLNHSSQPLAISHLERLLDFVVHTIVDPDDAAGRDTLRTRVTEYRLLLHRGAGDPLHASGEALLNACADAAENHSRLRAARRAEMAELVGMFRDMTTSLAGDGSAMTSEMTASATRFAALGNINDVRLLKERLSREVLRLKETARQKEEHWAGVTDTFRRKVEDLQAQLLVTQQEASIDPLTGVANRRLFDRKLGELLANPSHRFGLVLIDVDDFKQINDRDGHEAGDGVLKTIARTFAASVRAEDVVARLGGDEFALIFEDVTLSQASARVAAINKSLAPALAGEGLRPTTVSWGIAEFSAGDTPQSLTKRADEALYESKRQGRGRVTTRAAPLLRDLRRGVG